jgi:hypothetical protein
MTFEDRELQSQNMFWSVIKTAIIAFTIMVVLLNVQNNSFWYTSFDNCVNKGGVPGEFPIPGVDSPRFMCLPPSSPLIGGK